MRPIKAIIHTTALQHNLAVAKSFAGKAKTFAVIKANAYGHGFLPAAHALRAASGFALLDLHEAVWLRANGFQQPLLLLEGFFHESEIPLFAQYALTPVIHNAEQLQMLESNPLAKTLSVFLKMNSGMNRLGFTPGDFIKALERLKKISAISQITLLTHFACADEAAGITRQWEVFQQCVSGLHYPQSLANSATLLRFPHAIGDWVRPGIMLYGSSPFAEKLAADFDLLPAMTLQSELIGIQDIKAGDTVGYGAVFTASAAMRIGIVTCGYADGYPRHAPTGTPVAVEGTRTQLLGRVSMDMMAVDITAIAQARIGSRVELWGKQIAIDEVARRAGTIAYELMCAVAPRVEKVYE